MSQELSSQHRGEEGFYQAKNLRQYHSSWFKRRWQGARCILQWTTKRNLLLLRERRRTSLEVFLMLGKLPETLQRSCLEPYCCRRRYNINFCRILVKIVKLAQGRQIKGSKGDWKEFLEYQDRKVGSSVSDPGKRSWDVLAAFVNTFTAEEDIQVVARLVKWNKHHKHQQLLMSNSLCPETPEQELVRLTYEHPQFVKLYAFPSYHEGWMMTKLGKLSKAGIPDRMISIDCEMVRCEGGIEEVVKVCAVDHNLDTLMDTLVKPSKPVVDYLTTITGITAEDLEGVTCNLKDIQKALKNLLIPGTILVGHSLYHDLKALRLDHARVIDTAFIFRYKNKPSCYSPGLSKLCKVVLGYDMREEGKPHICLDDAIVAMKLTLSKLNHGLNDPLDMGDIDVSELDLSKLYIHKIPASVSMEKLQNLFPKKYSVEIQAFSRIKDKPSTTFAIFKSSEDANEAFENLRGELTQDSFGRPQKCVPLGKGDPKKRVDMSIRVRKMNVVKIEATDSQLHYSNDNLVPSVRKNHNESIGIISDVGTEGETVQKRKRAKHGKQEIQEIHAKTGLIKECNDCVHLKEQERLIKELEQRDAEIRNLQRVVSALTRKHGL